MVRIFYSKNPRLSKYNGTRVQVIASKDNATKNKPNLVCKVRFIDGEISDVTTAELFVA